MQIRTTAPDAEYGHHIFEIAGTKIVDGSIVGQCFHQYLRPPRKEDSWFPSYGAPPCFLREDISFAQIASGFVNYMRGTHVVMHNGRLDLELLDQELNAAGLDPMRSYCASITDTSVMARGVFGNGVRCSSLEALCLKLGLVPPDEDTYQFGPSYVALVARLYLAICHASNPPPSPSSP